jgi:hypothetical protein
MAGVRGEDIMIYDATGIRNVGQPIHHRIRANSNPEFQKVKFLVGTDYNLGDRMSPTADTTHPIRFSKGELPTGYPPRQVTEAAYMINMALLRPHGMAGVTLTAKSQCVAMHGKGYLSLSDCYIEISGRMPPGEPDQISLVEGDSGRLQVRGCTFRSRGKEPSVVLKQGLKHAIISENNGPNGVSIVNEIGDQAIIVNNEPHKPPAGVGQTII